MNLELHVEDNQLPSKFQIGDRVMFESHGGFVKLRPAIIKAITFEKDKIEYECWQQWGEDPEIGRGYWIPSDDVHPI